MSISAPFHQELPHRYQPKRMTIMEVSPRGKHGKKTSRGDSTQRSVAGSSISEFEDVLRTVEFQQSKIDQLTKRYCFNPFGLYSTKILNQRKKNIACGYDGSKDVLNCSIQSIDALLCCISWGS